MKWTMLGAGLMVSSICGMDLFVNNELSEIKSSLLLILRPKSGIALDVIHAVVYSDSDQFFKLISQDSAQAFLEDSTLKTACWLYKKACRVENLVKSSENQQIIDKNKMICEKLQELYDDSLLNTMCYGENLR